jgi:hypothetical protein
MQASGERQLSGLLNMGESRSANADRSPYVTDTLNAMSHSQSRINRSLNCRLVLGNQHDRGVTERNENRHHRGGVNP